jgi:hypothetical protein
MPPESENLRAEKIQRDIYRRMTPAQRWEQALNLRRTAWELTKAGIRSREPELTEEELEARTRDVFLHAAT